jgi:PAS domain S-box-containing protein
MHEEHASMIEDITTPAVAPPVPGDRHYQRLLSAVQGIVWEADAATMRFTFVSDGAAALLGYPARRWVDEPTFWLDHLHPEDRDWAMQLCVDAATQRRDHELEYRMLAADGRYLWLRETVTVDLDDAGKVRLRGVIVDISRQKAIEAELVRRDAILEAVRFAGERLLAPAGSWGESVQAVLERLGRATDVSRVYIFENYTGSDGELWATNTHEWVADPALSVIGRSQLQALSYRAMHLDRWLEAMARGEILYGHVRDMPEVERPEFEDEGTRSYVLVPIFVDGAWWGFIGFDDCVCERDSSRTERDALKAAADMLGAAMGREQELARRDAVLEAVRYAGERFLSGDGSWEESIDAVLERLGQATGVSRVYLYQNFTGPDGEIWGAKKHKWVQAELADRIAMSTRTEVSYLAMGLRRWVDAGLRGETLYGSIRDVPPAELLNDPPSTYPLSYVLAPIYVGGAWWGFIRFDEMVRERDFSAMERDALKAAADTLGAAIGRSRADQELRESQRSHQTLLSNLPGMAYRCRNEVDWRMEFVSEGATDLTGYQPDALIANRVLAYADLIHPEDSERVWEEVQAAVAADQPFRLVYRIIAADGSEKWVMEQGRAVGDEAGALNVLEGIVTDITEQVRAHEELRESQQSMQALLGNLPGMAYRSRPDMPWHVDFVSEGALELTGYPPSALTGSGESSLVRLIDADDRTALRHEIELAIAARQPFHLNYRIITADGTVKWVMEQGRAIHDENGEVDRLEGIITDVTDRIQARHLLQQRVEERTRELATLLSVSTSVASTLELAPLLGVILDQLRQVVDHVAAAIFALDGDGELRLLDYRGPTDRGQLATKWRLADADHSREVIARREPVIIPDVRAETPLAEAFRGKAVKDLGEVPDYIASWMGVPLIVRDRVIGLLAVDSGEPGAYTERHAELAEAFATQAAVAIENARLYEAAAERTRELGTLLEIGRNVAGTLELEPLLGMILDEVRAAVEYDGAGILIREAEGVLVQAAGRGPLPERTVEGIRVTLADAGPVREIIERGEPLVVDDVWADEPLARAYRHVVTEEWLRNRPYIRSWVGVPLHVRNRSLGLMTVAYAEPHYYTERDIELLTAMATQAAVAIENARLYEDAAGKAALEERQRLARELHDSVSQALFGIGLGARTARTLIDQDPAKAVAPIDYVLSLAEAGLAEMRALIFELRPEALEQEGLIAALQKQAAAMRARYGIAVEATLPVAVEVPQPVQEAIYRIAQEALHNIVKHARATRVTVEVGCEGGATTLRVADDGVGFDPGGSFPGHLGLRSMAERAEALGGTFAIDSAPGEGSTIRVSIPAGKA